MSVWYGSVVSDVRRCLMYVCVLWVYVCIVVCISERYARMHGVYSGVYVCNMCMWFYV